jgi:hypothetical protein
MPEDSPKSEVPDKVRFEYLKSSLFRIIHVDGA